jgi:hypothetical protein
MMSVPLLPRRREGGCPITTAVRRPSPNPSSPPHDTVPPDGPVVDLVLPDVIGDFSQASSQREARDLFALPLLDRAEPGAQGAGAAGRLCCGHPQAPAQEAISLLADVAGADSIRAGADPWREPDVAGEMRPHACPQAPAGWLTSLGLPFPVHLHWLPVNASWLDQIEIVFSDLQRKALTPNDFASTDHVRQRILAFFAERNRRAQPIRWTYTTQKLLAKVRRQRRLAATG